MRGAERQRRGNSQATAQFAGGQDSISGDIDLGADPGRIVPESGARFR